MIIQSHILLGRRMFDHLDPKEKMCIGKSHFILGNIIPDINKKYNFFHDYNKSIELVNDKIFKILYEKSTKLEISKNLGIINHFIADYFCSYHTFEEYKSKSIAEHFKYELQLHYYLKLYNKEIEHKEKNLVNDLSINDINNFIESMLQKYLGNNQSMLNDITFAFKVIFLVNKVILRELLYLEETERVVA